MAVVTEWAFGQFSALPAQHLTDPPEPANPAAPAHLAAPADPPAPPHAEQEPAPAPDAAATLPCCGPSARGPLSADDAETTAAVLKAVADPVRLRLLSLIRTSANCEACVVDLTAQVGLSQPTVSHHLRVLALAGLLERERRGTWAWYRVNTDRLSEIGDIFR